MRVITGRRLLDFAREHPDATESLDVWYRMMKRKKYEGPNDLKADFGTASYLGAELTGFNIGGIKYWLVAFIVYHRRRVCVHRVLTHAEYDRRSRDGTRGH